MNYKNSRDAAWQILIKNKISCLPVRVDRICKSERIRLFTYGEGKEIIERFKLEDNVISNDAFSFGRVIMYDDEKPITRQRFSIAHEIGHIFLHQPVGATLYNREISPNDNPIEAEANVFASRLLAPLCVLNGLNVSSAEEIAKICNISSIAAEIRYKRLCEIRERDNNFKRIRGYGCFLVSPLERKLYKHFEEYIKQNRK